MFTHSLSQLLSRLTLPIYCKIHLGKEDAFDFMILNWNALGYCAERRKHRLLQKYEETSEVIKEWNKQAELLTMRFSKIFDLYGNDNDDNQYVAIDNFYSVLRREDNKINRSNLKRALHTYQEGPVNINGKVSATVFSVLKYLFVHSSYKSCANIIQNVINELLDKESNKIPSSYELYTLIAKTRFRDNNDLFKTVEFDEDNISTLMKDFKLSFNESDWQTICWFENDFEKYYKTLDRNLPYEEILQLKYSKFQTLLDIVKTSKKWLNVSNEQIRQKTVRSIAADKENQVSICAGLVHIAPVLEKYIFLLLSTIIPDSIKHVVCFDPTVRRGSNNCLWAVLLTNKSILNEFNEVCTSIFYGCKRKDHVYMEYILVIDQADAQNFMCKDGSVYRFMLRDVYETGILQCKTTIWHAGDLIDGSIDLYDDPKNCETCFNSILSKLMSKESLDIHTEWYTELPIYTQVLLESFISKRVVKSHSSPKEFIRKKLVKLYTIYDTLLNLMNKKFVGVFQRANSKKLLNEYKCIGSVFEITLSAGATLSLRKAESELKSSASKDLCYYNTYLKELKLLYKSVTGEKDIVRLRDCHLILMLNNLVRLKYIADPNPGEHRSKQMCTLPITLQGLPLDCAITDTWHTADCDGSQYCICKDPMKLTSNDIRRTLLEPTEKELEMKKSSGKTYQVNYLTT